MQAGHKNTFDCIKAFSETDFSEDLKKFDVPTLILHGDDDQIVPISAAALRSAKLVKSATLAIRAGAKGHTVHAGAPKPSPRGLGTN
jgi:non-heme chloroperoxidase